MGELYRDQVERSAAKIKEVFGDLSYAQRKEIARLISEAAFAAEAFKYDNQRSQS